MSERMTIEKVKIFLYKSTNSTQYWSKLLEKLFKELRPTHADIGFKAIHEEYPERLGCTDQTFKIDC